MIGPVKVLAGLVALFLMACSSRTRGIYYIPFDRQDVGEVTAKTIEGKAEYQLPNAPETVRRELSHLFANPCDSPLEHIRIQVGIRFRG